MTKTSSDRYLGLTVGDGYRLKSFVGEGRVGRVYRAVSEYTGLTMACKVIREGGLKDGWQRELEKVRKLQGVDSVVQYYTHNTNYDQQNRPFHWVMFQYIDGRNLRETLADPQFSLTLPFVEAVLNTALNVLYACKEEDIAHGDLHAKNILIPNPDRRIRNSSPKVYVGDFGYGGSHNDIAPKDDFQELANVIADMLRRLQPNQLNARDKILYAGLRDFVQKRLRDGGRTPSVDSALLLSEFDQLIKRAEKQSAAGAREEEEEKTPSDYLWAEALDTARTNGETSLCRIFSQRMIS